jgi:hypothetical protein
MTDFIRLAVPIVWVIISTGAALALYKYSVTKVETRWMVFTGAGAIFLLSFCLLYRATPRELLWPSRTQVWDDLDRRITQQSQEISGLFSECLGAAVDQARCSDAILRIQRIGLEIHGVLASPPRD